MHVEQQLLDSVNLKLNQQHAIRAALITPIMALTVLISWFILVKYNETLAPVMLMLSGAAIGVAVRFAGKGYAIIFALIALLNHLIVVIAALALELTLVPGKALWAVLYCGFYLSGAWLASLLARHKVPFFEHKAYYTLAETKVHPSFKAMHNRWFTALPIAAVTTTLITTITTVVISEYRYHQYELQLEAQQQKADLLQQQRAIDVTPNNLINVSDDKALLHVYAYYSGYLLNKYNNTAQPYPRSTYKAKTILRYLIEQRDLARAKFVLGILEFEKNGIQLIQEAAAQGDVYAKIFQAEQFGCAVDKSLALKQLAILRRTITNKHQINHIAYVLSRNFEGASCNADYQPFFFKQYIL